MSPRLAFAIETAYRAGRSTLAHFRTGAPVETKADASPVTVADRNAERMIRAAIAEKFPDDAILGEEEGGDTDAPDRWIIDPIDGTKSFICGVPLYSTLLAYEQDGLPVLGVCYLPALDEMFYAERGGGAFVDGRPCRVSARPEISGGVITGGSVTSMEKHNRLAGYMRLAERTVAARNWGDAHGHTLVACGRVEAMLDPVVNRWDLSAVRIIVEEAGGRFTDYSGGDPFARGHDPLEAISSNGWVHEEIIEAFRR
jgi:histidinol phosphatase-like enzyme (inositol monophosphatase family)